MSEIKTFLLPDVGEGLTEAEILSWHVKRDKISMLQNIFHRFCNNIDIDKLVVVKIHTNLSIIYIFICSNHFHSQAQSHFRCCLSDASKTNNS